MQKEKRNERIWEIKMPDLGWEKQSKRCNERTHGFGGWKCKIWQVGDAKGKEGHNGGDISETGGERGGVAFGCRNGGFGQTGLTTLEHEPGPEKPRPTRPHLHHAPQRGH